MVGYIDDILIYLDSVDQHRDHVQEVLRCLQEAGLYVNPKKCNFHMDTIEYLGFILTPTGLHMDPAKVATIQNWLEPQNICDCQGASNPRSIRVIWVPSDLSFIYKVS